MCVGCGAELPKMKAKGNPRKWCSEPCRVSHAAFGSASRPRLKCQHCGESFVSVRRDQKWCGPKCSASAGHERAVARRGGRIVVEPRACAGCGRDWTPRANNADAVYCSRTCYSAENKRRYRARLASAPVVEIVRTREVLDRDGWICQLCSGPIDPAIRSGALMASVDHRVPLARGGNHTMANCQAAHMGCNSRKSDRLDEELLLVD